MTEAPRGEQRRVGPERQDEPQGNQREESDESEDDASPNENEGCDEDSMVEETYHRSKRAKLKAASKGQILRSRPWLIHWHALLSAAVAAGIQPGVFQDSIYSFATRTVPRFDLSK
jgi:hypothetical protein